MRKFSQWTKMTIKDKAHVYQTIKVAAFFLMCWGRSIEKKISNLICHIHKLWSSRKYERYKINISYDGTETIEQTFAFQYLISLERILSKNYRAPKSLVISLEIISLALIFFEFSNSPSETSNSICRLNQRTKRRVGSLDRALKGGILKVARFNYNVD